MDYDKIIDSTYSWFSLKKLFWFLVFFWIAIPILFVVPWALEQQYFDESVNWLVYLLYLVIYIGIIVGFVTLTCACLNYKKLNSKVLDKKSLIYTFALVFLELFYVFVWNIHKTYRFTQLLLLLGIPLLYFYYIFNPTLIILVSVLVFYILYVLMVIHNAVRLFFTVTIFYNKNVSINEAIKESWHLTHGRFIKTFFSIILVFGVVFVMFAVIAIILGAIAHLIFLSYFTVAVAGNLAQMVAFVFAIGPAIISYYLGIIEVYAQLEKENISSLRVKRLLARKVLTKEKNVPVKTRIVKKKKVFKEKVVKKKVKKKKVVNKKATKKKASSKK